MAQPVDCAALHALVAALVRQPSVNPSIDREGGVGEAAVAAVACEWLTNRGVRAWLEDAAPNRPNVVAELGAAKSPTLVLCAHLDTVRTAGMSISPFDARIEAGRLYGRGAYDMKGGAAAVMAAAHILNQQALPGRALVALVADEEHESVGARAFVERYSGQGASSLSPLRSNWSWRTRGSFGSTSRPSAARPTAGDSISASAPSREWLRSSPRSSDWTKMCCAGVVSSLSIRVPDELMAPVFILPEPVEEPC